MERLSPSAAFRINTPRVAHQTLDGETIIIDFDSGAYFSTNATGAAIWQLIAQNATVNQMIQVLRQSYSGNHDAIWQGVEQFLSELQQDLLIVQLDQSPAASDPTPAMPNPNSAPQLPFVPPSLDKYIDMQDLLLLDAIHDVDPQGWPLKKDETAG